MLRNHFSLLLIIQTRSQSLFCPPLHHSSTIEHSLTLPGVCLWDIRLFVRSMCWIPWLADETFSICWSIRQDDRDQHRPAIDIEQWAQTLNCKSKLFQFRLLVLLLLYPPLVLLLHCSHSKRCLLSPERNVNYRLSAPKFKGGKASKGLSLAIPHWRTITARYGR